MCHTDHASKHHNVPVCCTYYFSHGLEETAPVASIPPSIDNTTLSPDASVAAYLPPIAPPDALIPYVSPPSNDPMLSPKRRKGAAGPIPTSCANTASSKKIKSK
eukprot:11938737-Ditylum_brightwellii.AAC.1